MKNARLSAAGKALIFIFGGATIGGSASYGIYQSIASDTPAVTAPADGVNTLVNEFSAAVSAEAKAKMEEAAANAGKPAAVKTACADLAAMMENLSAASGIAAKITVPYEGPSTYFEFGYCALKINDEALTYITKGDELGSESDRGYIIRKLIEKLPADDIVKIHQTLGKGPQP